MIELPPVPALLGWVRDGQQRLEREVAALPASAVPEPSELEGWTRGHVITHVARNADALVNLLVWAHTGTETPMYPSAERRDADIEAGAGRGLAEQVADLRTAAQRFAEAADAMTDDDWSAIVRTMQGVDLPAAQVPWMRVREVWIHLADLGIGVGMEALPDELAWTLTQDVAAAISPRVDVAVELSAPEHGTIRLGSSEPAGQVSGPPGLLAGWLTGRSGPGAVHTSGTVPTLPRWL